MATEHTYSKSILMKKTEGKKITLVTETSG